VVVLVHAPLVVMIVDMVAVPVRPHATMIVVVHLVVIMTIVGEDMMTVGMIVAGTVRTAVGMIVRTGPLALPRVKQVAILVPADHIGLVVAMYGCKCHIWNVLLWRGNKSVQALYIFGISPLYALWRSPC
jgi:hypothetical protein